MIRLSLDTETLGIRRGSQIAQIACCDLDNPSDFFNVYIDLSDQAALGLTTDQSTLDFWAAQDQAIRDKVWGGALDLETALICFQIWLTDITAKEPFEIWMNSPSFDSEKILAPAFDLIDLALPWQFHQERDFRTLQNISKTYCNFPYQKPSGAHDALVDAQAQGAFIYEAINRIKFFCSQK